MNTEYMMAKKFSASTIGWVRNCGVEVLDNLLYKEDGEWEFAIEVYTQDTEIAVRHCKETGIEDIEMLVIPDDETHTRIYGKIKLNKED